ncbi:hypothetical protein HPC62_21215 [Thermoleptolyngbya sichuanensis A183]|uniref:Uncharacterized protein n=1 Tax=Thermoleptolyngbya sichuanensis A183 TaxID=2737172 RepID=A0A6M8BL12_9CYAN|nr:hypothetical protein [Thermoleptolyngbya sichuanensis]QKD84361.1 hypothetical protein HPC62_21215 [Thermoleptolyngbya sichuanensis A183]
MKSDLQSTRQWQCLLLSGSVLVSTVIVGGQAAVASEAIVAEAAAAESIAAESTTKSGSVRSTIPPLSPIRSLSVEPLLVEPLESVEVAPEAAVAPEPVVVVPDAEPDSESTTGLTTTPSIESAEVGSDEVEAAEIEIPMGTAADLEPMPTNPAIANTDTELDPDLSDPSFSVPAPIEIAQTGPREVRYVFSYIGVGVNLGIAGDAAIGDTSFAVLSKIALNPYLSLRPSLLIEDDVSILVPVTYDFGIAGPGTGIAPFAGLGLTFSTGNDNNVDFLLTGGLDFPINSSLVATASANLAPFGREVDFGILLGLGYTFSARRAVVRRPTIADVQDAVGGTADTLGRRSRINPSFIGAGANLGIGGDSALGNTSFAILSKFALNRTLSIRPGLLIEDDVEVLLPVTFDLEPIRTGYTTLAPYVGAGIAFSFGDDSGLDLLLTGGLDIPLTAFLALTTGINVGLFDSFDVGATLGLVYTFSPY